MPTSSDPGRRPVAVLLTHESAGVDDTGIVGGHLESLGYDLVRHQVFLSTDPDGTPDLDLPELDGVDVVVVFGSTAHSWEGRHRHWVDREVAWVRDALDRGLTFIGICFGSQLLAMAVGGSAVASGTTEVGMLTFPTEAGCPVADGPWFSWHSDVVVLPEHATVWSRNEVGPQVFTVGRALGVQFHPEVTVELAEAWIDAWPGDLPGSLTADAFREQVRNEAPAAQSACREAITWAVRTLPTRDTI